MFYREVRDPLNVGGFYAQRIEENSFCVLPESGREGAVKVRRSSHIDALKHHTQGLGGCVHAGVNDSVRGVHRIPQYRHAGYPGSSFLE